jgi:hypothetical protein
VAAGRSDQDRSGLRPPAIGRVALATVVLVILGGGSAHAAALSGAGISGTVTASVKPSSLPKRGSAPVTLSIEGTVDVEQPKPIKTVTVQLDRQLAVSGARLPTCQPGEVTGIVPAAARRKCKGALVGSGGLTQRFQYPEQAPFDVHGSMLFFNGAGSHLLTYVFLPDPQGPFAVATPSSTKGGFFETRLPVGGTTTAFQFRFGKTWNREGKKFGYLSGRCATGTLRNRITLSLFGGGTASASLPQQCQGRA